jgi:hypothetical protein
MSEPLEVMYERCQDPECDSPTPHYAGDEGWELWKASDWAYEKHLTDAELAAEYWRSWNLFKTGNNSAHRDWAEYDRSQILHRFATTPHYDEVTA